MKIKFPHALKLLNPRAMLYGFFMRVICLDVGSKRIGVAASDPMGLTAQPVKVIDRRGGQADLKAIEAVCDELSPEKLIVGLPYDEEGGIGQQAKKIMAFTERLREYLLQSGKKFPIEFWDERFSTVKAENRLIEANVSRAKRRKVIDKMAAVAILEDYLDSIT